MIPPPLPESEIQARVMRALSEDPDCRMFRNNCGSGWVGAFMGRRADGMTILANARPIKFGLMPGSSDAIGWKTITVTQADVGRRLAIFASVEIKKSTGRTSPDQLNWLAVTKQAGAFSGVARSPEDARAIVTRP